MTQIKSLTKEVLFEYDGMIKEAVEEAVRQGISLAFADLYGADLSNASLERANLFHASLAFADLNGVCLNGAKLIGADLSGAILYNADLKGADLEGADLRDAYLKCADLKGATLRGANLKCAYLKLAKNIPDDIMPLACPTEGSFIAWKKVGDKLVKLEIPSDAKRSSATGHKCRCSKAKVLAITNLDETVPFDEVINCNYVPLTYKVGEMVYPDWFDEYRWAECSNGIHFFMDKKEAINWVF